MQRTALFLKRGNWSYINGFMENMFRLENLFVFFVLVFGTLFAVLVPSNQVPDEGAHIARVYGTLDGNLTSNYIYLPDHVFTLMKKYFPADLQTTNIHIADYLNEFSLKSGGRASEPIFAAPYNPILYIPQLIGVSIGKLFRLGDLTTLVLGRIGSLLVYIGIGYALLKKTPVARKSLFVLLTMPMSVFLAASYSADAVQNLLSFVYMSMIVSGLSSQEKLSKKELALLLGVSILLSLSKPVSLLVILLSLAIPVTRFKNHKQKAHFILIQLGLALLFAFLSSRLTSLVYAFDYIKPKMQLFYIFLEPISYIKVFFTSLSQFLEEWYYGFVGKFGWLTIHMPGFVYFVFPIAMSLAMLIDRKQPLMMTKEQRYIFGGVFVLYAVAVITSMYLYWNPVGSPVVGGVQGRYFISITPILLYLFLSFNHQGKLLWEGVADRMVVLLVPIMLFFAIQTIYLNYYVPCGKHFYEINGSCSLPVDLPAETTIGKITKPVTQTFIAECNDLTRVDVYFATPARKNRGFLQVSLRNETSNTLVFEKNLNIAKLTENEWQPFLFPLIQNVNGNKFTLTLSPQGSTLGNAITVWATASDIYPQGELSGSQNGSDIVFRYVCRYGIVNEFLDLSN